MNPAPFSPRRSAAWELVKRCSIRKMTIHSPKRECKRRHTNALGNVNVSVAISPNTQFHTRKRLILSDLQERGSREISFTRRCAMFAAKMLMKQSCSAAACPPSLEKFNLKHSSFFKKGYFPPHKLRLSTTKTQVNISSIRVPTRTSLYSRLGIEVKLFAPNLNHCQETRPLSYL